MLIGRLFPQRGVTHDGRSIRFDDLASSCFLLVSLETTATDLPANVLEPIRQIGGRSIRLTARGLPDAVTDADGFYTDWFTEAGVRAVVVRPDHYIYGVAATTTDIPALLLRLNAAVTSRRTPQQL